MYAPLGGIPTRPDHTRLRREGQTKNATAIRIMAANGAIRIMAANGAEDRLKPELQTQQCSIGRRS